MMTKERKKENKQEFVTESKDLRENLIPRNNKCKRTDPSSNSSELSQAHVQITTLSLSFNPPGLYSAMIIQFTRPTFVKLAITAIVCILIHCSSF